MPVFESIFEILSRFFVEVILDGIFGGLIRLLKRGYLFLKRRMGG
jgi:hypothetical protein